MEKSHNQTKRLPEITFRRWRYTRFWGVYLDGKLLTIVVYKKGALALEEYLRTGHIRGEH